MPDHPSRSMCGKLSREFRRCPLVIDTDKEGEYPVEDQYDPEKVSIVQDL